VENGEVIAMLDITKCLYDAISRVERATEQGSAIAAAVEGVELRQPSHLPGWLTVLLLHTFLFMMLIFHVLSSCFNDANFLFQLSMFFSVTNTFIETLRERVFKPSLTTIVGENTK